MAQLADLLGRRLVYVSSLVISAALGTVTYFITDFWTLVVVRALGGAMSVVSYSLRSKRTKACRVCATCH